MKELEVRIHSLEPLRVAAAHGFGQGPEPIAWEKLTAYIRKTGLLSDGQPHRFFGFNNPDPSPGSPNYGYEQWVTVGPEAQGEGEVKVKEFGGGLYAVTRTSLAEITETWQAFFAWLEGTAYRFGSQQWLEEAINFDLDQTVDQQGPENLILDLYMPITE
jgi:DNA gyrase inhibitor GyrI